MVTVIRKTALPSKTPFRVLFIKQEESWFAYDGFDLAVAQGVAFLGEWRGYRVSTNF